MANKFLSQMTTYYAALAIGIVSLARGAKASEVVLTKQDLTTVTINRTSGTAPAAHVYSVPPAVAAQVARVAPVAQASASDAGAINHTSYAAGRAALSAEVAKAPSVTVSPDEKLFLFLQNVEGFAPVKFKDGFYTDAKTGKVLPIGESIYFGHQLQKGEVLPNYTREQALGLLHEDIAKKEAIVTHWAKNHGVTLTPCQKAGLTGIVYNAGGVVLQGTVGKKLIAGDIEGAADAFLLWDKTHDSTGALIQTDYQKSRRTYDRAMFLGDDAKVSEGIDWAYDYNHNISHHAGGKKMTGHKRAPSRS